MQIGMVGLGRMGAGMARRLMDKDIGCVVYDPQEDAVARLVADGAQVAAGDAVALIEAMKMETRIPAPKAGRIRIEAEAGTTVGLGAKLATIG